MKDFNEFMRQLIDVNGNDNFSIFTTYKGIPLGVKMTIDGQYIHCLYPFSIKKGIISDKILYDSSFDWLEQYINLFPYTYDDFLVLYIEPNPFFNPITKIPYFNTVLEKFYEFESKWLKIGPQFYTHISGFRKISKDVLYKIDESKKQIFVFIIKNSSCKFFKIDSIQRYMDFLGVVGQYNIAVVDIFIKKTAYVFEKEDEIKEYIKSMANISI